MKRLGLSDFVRFTPWLSAEELSKESDSHDVLSFLSFQDSGGFVVLESLMHRLPVVCLDIGGPPMVLRCGGGFVVKAISPHQVTEEVATIFLAMAQSPEARPKVTDSILLDVQERYGWDRLAPFLDALYESAVRS